MARAIEIPKTWAIPVNTGRFVRLIKPSSLPPVTKHILWQGIKALEPETAELLKNDAVVETLKNHFDASIVFSESEITRFVNAGKKTMRRKNHE